MSTMPLRVTVLDTWDAVPFDVPASTRVSDVKREALVRAGVHAAPERYLVKYDGAELPENGATLADAGVRPNGALIVLSRRRIPVR
jgi:hypothetical protein